MPNGAHSGFAALLLTGLLGAIPAYGQSSTTGNWTDPPVRGSAAQSAKTQPDVPVKPIDSAAAPAKVVTPGSKADAVAEVRSTRRTAKVKRERIREAAIRNERYAQSRFRAPRATRVAAQPRIRADRYHVQRYGNDWRRSARVVSIYPARRAGWGGLIGSEQDRRIAEAREAGYLVMRSRTYAGPFGMPVRTLEPLDPDDIE